MKKLIFLGRCGGGQAVSVVALNSDDLSSNCVKFARKK